MVIFDYCLTIKIYILLHQIAFSIYFNMSRYILFACCLLFCLSLSAQQKYTLSGTVTDVSNGEKLLGVNLLIKGTQMGTSTNEYGFYSLTLPEGEYTLQVEFLGFKTIEEPLHLKGNQHRNYKLQEEGIEIGRAHV